MIWYSELRAHLSGSYPKIWRESFFMPHVFQNMREVVSNELERHKVCSRKTARTALMCFLYEIRGQMPFWILDGRAQVVESPCFSSSE